MEGADFFCWFLVHYTYSCTIYSLLIQRSEEVDRLQGQIDDIKRAMEPLVGRSHPLFVKDGDTDAQGNSPEVNNWGVYNAYK